MIIDRRTVISSLAATAAFALPASAQMVSGGSAPAPSRPGTPRWMRNAMPVPKPDGRPAITLIVDDMGVVHPGTNRVMALPSPITLAWFPFARHLPEQVAEARARGHEAILHMPMQASGKSMAWTGPDPLSILASPAENLRRLQAALDAVPDTVGLNNHMGSVATLNSDLMDLVAAEAKRREMLVLDSVTIPHSKVYSQAALIGVPAASRDIFIDWTPNPASIRTQIALVEATAIKHGHVIAIAHPWPHSIEAMEAWVPTLERRGFALWPLSATVALKNEIMLAV